MPVAVPEFTDTTDWVGLADPRSQRVLRVAFLQEPGGMSIPLPEIYDVSDPGSGMVFLYDAFPVKARDWFAVGISTAVGIIKSFVAG